jgi:hypothetical protein
MVLQTLYWMSYMVHYQTDLVHLMASTQHRCTQAPTAITTSRTIFLQLLLTLLRMLTILWLLLLVLLVLVL